MKLENITGQPNQPPKAIASFYFTSTLLFYTHTWYNSGKMCYYAIPSWSLGFDF